MVQEEIHRKFQGIKPCLRLTPIVCILASLKQVSEQVELLESAPGKSGNMFGQSCEHDVLKSCRNLEKSTKFEDKPF